MNNIAETSDHFISSRFDDGDVAPASCRQQRLETIVGPTGGSYINLVDLSRSFKHLRYRPAPVNEFHQ